MTAQSWFLLYILVLNLVSFFLFGLDKWKALHGRWRIPEKTLFLSAILGGSFGARLGMSVFRHKTRKRSFAIGIPLIFLAQFVLVLGYYWITGAAA